MRFSGLSLPFRLIGTAFCRCYLNATQPLALYGILKKNGECRVLQGYNFADNNREVVLSNLLGSGRLSEVGQKGCNAEGNSFRTKGEFWVRLT